MRFWPILLALSMLALTGCGERKAEEKVVAKPAPLERKTAPHTQAPSPKGKGWIETKVAGVAFSLPDDMAAFDLTTKDVANMTRGIKSAFPKSPDAEKTVSQALGNGNIKLIAMEKRLIDRHFRSVMNLIEAPVPPGTDAAKMLAQNELQFKTMKTPMDKSVVTTIPAGKAVYIEADLKIPSGKVSIASYTLLKNDEQYVFTYTCPAVFKKQWRELAKKSMETMRFTN